jgi:hypothetical protein
MTFGKRLGHILHGVFDSDKAGRDLIEGKGSYSHLSHTATSAGYQFKKALGGLAGKKHNKARVKEVLSQVGRKAKREAPYMEARVAKLKDIHREARQYQKKIRKYASGGIEHGKTNSPPVSRNDGRRSNSWIP